MGRARISLGSGIIVEYGALKFALDPKIPAPVDYTFVSHAHLDHVHTPSIKSKVIASRATKKLAIIRGYDLGETIEHVEGVKLLDSGHILGSRAICIGDEVIYTGDAAGRERAFLAKCKTRRARTLIIETTFGSPEYVFPEVQTVIKEVNEMIARAFERGKAVVLMGYLLGKAQVLSYLFSMWAPLYVHERVARMNDIYRECGVKMRAEKAISENMEGLPSGPFVMVAPMMNSTSDFIRRLKKSHGAVLAVFSGWAVDRGYRSMMGVDFAFPLSDHCDHRELLSIVNEVSPELVYTTHGFTEEFAQELRRLGYDAKPLNGYQSDLTQYTEAD